MTSEAFSKRAHRLAQVILALLTVKIAVLAP
jgi:hypothetical protein